MRLRPRHQWALALVLTTVVATPGNEALSQTTRTVRLVVPYTPGSGPDILARLVAEQAGRQNGPTVVVEDRPGAGTVIGTEAVARSAPDGNTVLMVAPSFIINPSLRKVNYDPLRDFEPTYVGSGQTRSFGDVGSSVRLPESGHGWTITT